MAVSHVCFREGDGSMARPTRIIVRRILLAAAMLGVVGAGTVVASPTPAAHACTPILCTMVHLPPTVTGISPQYNTMYVGGTTTWAYDDVYVEAWDGNTGAWLGTGYGSANYAANYSVKL